MREPFVDWLIRGVGLRRLAHEALPEMLEDGREPISELEVTNRVQGVDDEEQAEANSIRGLAL